jgi:hypothetical protein
MVALVFVIVAVALGVSLFYRPLLVRRSSNGLTDRGCTPKAVIQRRSVPMTETE